MKATARESKRLILFASCLILILIIFISGAYYPPFIFHSTDINAIVTELTLEDIIAQADLIIVGEVNGFTYVEDNEWGIVTLYAVDVEKTVKGSPFLREVFVQVPGGELNGIITTWEEAPSFQIGGKWILFLREIPGTSAGCSRQPTYFSVVGWFQGAFYIEGDRVSGLSIGEMKLEDFIDQIRKLR